MCPSRVVVKRAKPVSPPERNGATGSPRAMARGAAGEAPGLSYEGSPRVLQAAKQVGRPIFFSLAIIIVSFLPVFLLGAGRTDVPPLAFMKTFAMAAASVLAVTVVLC